MTPQRHSRTVILGCLLLVPGIRAIAAPRAISLDRTDTLELRNAKAEIVQYRGRSAVKLVEATQSSEPSFAVLKNVSLRDGSIEIEVAGAPATGAGEGARGFVGVAFRVGADGKRFEYIYLRPTNGRVNDQVRRNHSVQYASHPDYPWQRLRKEEPEKYESYVDLEPGVWTKMRIVFSGTKATLHVHGAAQPTLVVNDLKLGSGEGGIALWIGPDTEAHFSRMSVSE